MTFIPDQCLDAGDHATMRLAVAYLEEAEPEMARPIGHAPCAAPTTPEGLCGRWAAGAQSYAAPVS